MRKWVCCVLGLMLAGTISAQFKVDIDGITDYTTGKSYIVREFPGKTAGELYDACASVLTMKMHTSDLNFDGSLDKMITFTQYLPDRIFAFRSLGTNFYMNIDFSVNMRFADGKVRVDSPLIREMYYTNKEQLSDGRIKTVFNYYFVTAEDAERSSEGGTSIYDKRGRLKHDAIRESLEDFLNSYIDGILANMDAQLNPDQW